MKISARIQLTLLFSAIFTALLLLSSTLVYLRVAKSLEKEFKLELIHDGRIMAELFKEELKLNALDEFQEELKEFGFDLQILDQNHKPLVQSEGWNKLGISIDSSTIKASNEKPVFNEITVNDKTFAIFSRFIHIPSSGDYSLHLARSKESFQKTLNTLLQWMLIIKPFMLFVAAFCGYLFSYRILKAEERAFDRLKHFTADASHELRIPLTALRGNLDVALRKDRSPEEYKVTLQEALEEAENLSQLTQDLLLLAQTDEGKLKLKLERTNIRTFLEDVFHQSQSIKNELGIKLILKKLPEGEAIFDPERIRQMLFNLIENGIKYNQPGGEVNLQAELTKESLKLIVQDSGIGLSGPDQAKIFDRFFRVDKARSREQGGVGLGLSIVRWIVDEHHGQIDVQSEMGRGTTFTVTLPLI